MAPDVEAAGRFYATVLGWTVPAPDDQWGGYVVAHVDGAAAAGIGPVQQGARATWMLYVASDDADGHATGARTAGGSVLSDPGSSTSPAGWCGRTCADTDTAVAAAEVAGGSVIAPPTDTPYGRLAGLADPNGAVFVVMGTSGDGAPDRSD